MTVLGKILVIVNFVFTLVTAALIIFAYSARTNWAAAYKKLEDSHKVAQANAVTFMGEADEVKKKSDIEIKQLTDQLAQSRIERDRFEKENKDYANKLEQAKTLTGSVNTNVTNVTEELQRRRDEIDKQKGFVVALEQKVQELQKEKQDMRDRAIAGELSSKSEHDRNTNLLSQVENLTREVTKTQANGGTVVRTAGTERNPPPEDVEGLVLETDPETGYMTLSIGSDAGLSRGNTLEVYRLRPEPKYLGTIQVLEVRADRAVAKPAASQRRGQILVGDRVASNIVSKR